MLLFMHITLGNAEDHCECGLGGVLAPSFQDIVPEEKESLLCTVWLSRNAPNQMLSFAVCAGSGKEGGCTP